MGCGEFQKHKKNICSHTKIWKSLDSTGERARNNLNVAVVCLLEYSGDNCMELRKHMDEDSLQVCDVALYISNVLFPGVG